MDVICPICNGLQTLETTCPRCLEQLQNMGPVIDWLGPYAPYENDWILKVKGNMENAVCVHLFSCGRCGYDIRIPIAAMQA
ncbi:hypothetical protein LSG31_18165 [Fodinisporobacter ferrooxydans]|uniref:RNHCP domain-containing protein n=1 Tax=Fodinisporobacter ferrooxydans TaxID=2901836 RepID=A0ABY4CKT5_9BACL|nr:hypothetical protein LSG31_18165 [Alicyclobacillaceae bacterium MYW30-H2]